MYVVETEMKERNEEEEEEDVAETTNCARKVFVFVRRRKRERERRRRVGPNGTWSATRLGAPYQLRTLDSSGHWTLAWAGMYSVLAMH